MSQSTLEDDDLFGEAAAEIRTDVEESLEAARSALPEPDEIWEIEAENTLGTLNTLRSALDVEEARDHFRDAKKWYTMGQRADAFEDADELEAAFEELEALMSDLDDAHERVGDLVGLVPDLRSELGSVADGADAGDEDEE